MPHWITCDEVFDVLTRGPFPTGSEDGVDDAVELHISGCHECRQLAEALRPAVHLLQEAMAEEGLPTYRGAIQPSFPSNWQPVFNASDGSDPTDRSTSAPSDPSPLSEPTGRHAPWHACPRVDHKSLWLAQLTRIAAAVLLILLMISAIPAIGWLRGDTSSPAAQRARLLAAPLPNVCRVALIASDPMSVAEGCCANCHHASGANSSPGVGNLVAQHLQLVTNSCRACHE